MKVILGSSSPRRKELLQLILPKFDIVVSEVNEELKDGLAVQEQVTRLAYVKAKEVYDKTDGDRIIIGADTIVVKNNKIYGKPTDRKHAKQMLKELLSGDKTHSIITGLCVIIEKDRECRVYKDFDEVKVFLRDMNEKEIDMWLDTGNAMDKAGAYGIQNEFCVFVDKIEGNYTSAVGLPTHRLYNIIKEYI